MTRLSFTALDVETATSKNNSICQIGIVVVNKAVIERKFSFLVQPPENKYDYHNIRVHGINSNMTTNAPRFNEIWAEISKYIIDREIVCHNASFDISKLTNTLDYYNIPRPKLKYTCTYEIYQQKLDKCCNTYDIEISNHHDALADAEACAKLYLNFLEKNEKITIPKNEKTPFLNKKIECEDLKPDFNIENTDNPFFKKKVVFTGDLVNFTRKEAAHTIKLLGANVNTSISKKTDFVIIGRNPGPSKMKKITELGIPTISEDDFLKLLDATDSPVL